MKNALIVVVIAFCTQQLKSQISIDYFAPHVFMGKGINDMKDISFVAGIGYDFGYEMTGSNFGIYGFFNSGTYSRMKDELPIFRPQSGMETLPIINKSNVSTYGLKLRYTIGKLNHNRLKPYIEIGGGFARHKNFWKSNGMYLENQDTEAEDCPKKAFQEKERIIRNTAMMGVAEIGLSYCVTKDGFIPENYNGVRNSGYYITLSARLEYGGTVIYNNLKNHPYRFYYNSGLGNEQDRPYSHLAPPRSLSNNFDSGRHTMILFQLSLSRVIF